MADILTKKSHHRSIFTTYQHPKVYLVSKGYSRCFLRFVFAVAIPDNSIAVMPPPLPPAPSTPLPPPPPLRRRGAAARAESVERGLILTSQHHSIYYKVTVECIC